MLVTPKNVAQILKTRIECGSSWWGCGGSCSSGVEESLGKAKRRRKVMKRMKRNWRRTMKAMDSVKR